MGVLVSLIPSLLDLPILLPQPPLTSLLMISKVVEVTHGVRMGTRILDGVTRTRIPTAGGMTTKIPTAGVKVTMAMAMTMYGAPLETTVSRINLPKRPMILPIPNQTPKLIMGPKVMIVKTVGEILGARTIKIMDGTIRVMTVVVARTTIPPHSSSNNGIVRTIPEGIKASNRILGPTKATSLSGADHQVRSRALSDTPDKVAPLVVVMGGKETVAGEIMIKVQALRKCLEHGEAEDLVVVAPTGNPPVHSHGHLGMGLWTTTITTTTTAVGPHPLAHNLVLMVV